jgi:hypothetical protein
LTDALFLAVDTLGYVLQQITDKVLLKINEVLERRVIEERLLHILRNSCRARAL